MSPVRRRRSVTRKSPSRRRSHRGRSRPRLQLMVAGVVAAIVLTAAFTFTLLKAQQPRVTDPAPPRSQPVGAVLVYTAPSSTEGGVHLPSTVRDDLRTLGRDQKSVTLVRVEADGAISQTSIDLTPRAGGHVLKVEERADQAINTTLDGMEATMGTPTGDGATSRALYTGLLRASIPDGVPLYLLSSLDLTDPLDFRKLAFGVAPERIVEVLTEAGQVPDIAGSPVTFVLLPAAGEQPRMRNAEKTYTKNVWREVLMRGAGASDVVFLEGLDVPTSATASTPIVPLPDLPGTPIKPAVDPAAPEETICTVPSTTYFEYGDATLTYPAATADALRSCIAKALEANAPITIDAWTSYEGRLDGTGRPVENPPADVKLSQARAEAIRSVLTDRLGVPAANIARVVGHGSDSQPDPDPRSAANRVTVVRYTS